MAQDKLWVNGNQILDFNDTQNGMSVCGLPTGHDYTGAPAQYSQNAQYDENGKLLFFVQDGNIYDNAGYLMADNDASPNCVNCLVKGIQEIAIIRMPNSCDKYYIIGANKIGQRVALGYSVLDLDKPNPFHVGRRGAVWSNIDADNANEITISSQLYQSYEGITEPPMDHYTCQLGNLGQSSDASSSAQIKVMDSGDPTRPPLLLARNQSALYAANITEHGIMELNNIRTLYYSSSDSELNYSGQMDVAVEDYNEQTFRLVLTENNANHPTPFNNTSIWLAQLDFNNGQISYPLSNPTPINTNLYGATQGAGKVHGIAFSPNGRYLYFAQAFAPYIGYIDMQDPLYTVHDIGYDWGWSGMDVYGQGQIAVNKSPAGNGWGALYFPFSGGMGCLDNVDFPWMLTWTPNVSAGNTPVGVPSNSFWSTSHDPPYNQYLMDLQNYDEQQVTNLERSVCCQTNERIPEASHPYEFSGITTSSVPWTPQNNGLTDAVLCPPATGSSATGYAYFTQDYVVHAGAQLFVQDMDWRFAPTARLIVERGAFVHFNNCTLQGTLDVMCQPQRWPGIRIEGTTTASQTPLVGGAQGYVSMVNTTVANAVYGVMCLREGNIIGDPDYFGGVIRAHGCTFKNCTSGVWITYYNHNNAPQASSFYDCTFVTDTDRPDQTIPHVHAYVASTRTVNFTNCRFANYTGIFNDHNGFGVQVNQGQVNVSGNDYGNSFFENLTYAVYNTGGGLAPSTVNHMEFRGNSYGILDLGSTFSRYTNNRFLLPSQGGSPFPYVGMYLWQPQLYTIERNQFIGMDGPQHNIGIYFRGINTSLSTDYWFYTDSRIYDNTFTGLEAGCIVKSVHRGTNPSELDGGLSILCGDYTDNIYDIALLEASIIKPDQGHQGQGQQLSGNRFLTTANCTSTWDWNLDPAWNDVPGLYHGMHLNVFRSEDPVCDVQCEYWPDFADIAVLNSGAWTAGGTCDGGILDQSHTIPGGLTQYHLAKSQLESALNAYNGNLDAGEKPDLIDLLLKQEPPLPSSTVRDALLANSPLSDEVLITMLKREPALDPWHLTQVLVANVKLNTGVIETAKELLSPFYFGVVQDAQDGSGITWKQLMEQEIEQRRREKAQALASLGYLYGTDSTYEGAVDSLRVLLATDSDPEYTQARTAMYIFDQNWSEAEAELSGPAEKLNGWQTYVELMESGRNHDGQWSRLESNEVAALDEQMREGGAGAALAGGILFSNGFTDYMPEVQFPREEPFQRLVPVHATEVVARPALALYPNPANTEAYLKWPIEQKGSLIQVMDTQGRILLEHQAVENGLSRLDLSQLPAGLYKVYLDGSGLSSSFSIVR